MEEPLELRRKQWKAQVELCLSKGVLSKGRILKTMRLMSHRKEQASWRALALTYTVILLSMELKQLIFLRRRQSEEIVKEASI